MGEKQELRKGYESPSGADAIRIHQAQAEQYYTTNISICNGVLEIFYYFLFLFLFYIIFEFLSARMPVRPERARCAHLISSARSAEHHSSAPPQLHTAQQGLQAKKTSAPDRAQNMHNAAALGGGVTVVIFNILRDFD